MAPRQGVLLLRWLCLLVPVTSGGGSGALFPGDVGSLINELDPIQFGLQPLGLMAALGSYVSLYNAYFVINDHDDGIWEKASACGMALAFLALVWVGMVGHLVDFNTTF